MSNLFGPEADETYTIYVVGCVGMAGPLKIGFSKRPEERLCDLQIGSPLRLGILATYTINARRCRRVEKCAHDNLQNKHSHGEWFDCSVEEAKQAIENAIESNDTAEVSKKSKAFSRNGSHVIVYDARWLEAAFYKS